MSGASPIRIAVIALLVIAGAAAFVLTSMQGPFDASTFAFQNYREYSGLVSLQPAPALQTSEGVFLLTRPGKFSAEPWLRAWEGRPVRMRGALIALGRDRMLEIEPGSLRGGSGRLSSAEEESVGWVELRGEIADGKCYLGVMNPGRGKVHRDCAVRCLSGGAPAVFLARDAGGELRVLLLTEFDRGLLSYVAEPVRLRGELRRKGAQLLLAADWSSLRRE